MEPNDLFATPSITQTGERTTEAGVRQAADLTTGFLVVGHGTRTPSGQQQFRHVFKQFAEIMSGKTTELGFLELADPDIPAAIRRLARQRVERIVTVPVLLFGAGHAQVDIPQQVEKAAAEVGIRRLVQTPPLGCVDSMVELSAWRFRQAVCTQAGQTPCLRECSGQFCGRTGLVMVGRGSRSDAATAEMRMFTELRRNVTAVRFARTAFIYGQSPTVEEALDELQQAPVDWAVVQPHLLFDGQLMTQLRAQVTERQSKDSRKTWILTNPLGADRRLAAALASLAVDCEKRIKTAEPGFSNS